MLTPSAPVPNGTTDGADNNANNDSNPGAGLRWARAPPFTPALYLDLAKARLAALVLLTTMAGYAAAPGAAGVVPLLWTTLGTGLCVASANAFNQWLEAPYDAQMARTRGRPLVRHAVTAPHAFLAAAVAGVAGVGVLAACVNAPAAVLGAANIALYAAAYTPLKRASVLNTWAGAVVGAVPPLLGWAARAGSLADPGAIVLAL
ncbi:Protoheme IX farnesyltransferase, mitochondrial, partial [Cladochytrium tenue]